MWLWLYVSLGINPVLGDHQSSQHAGTCTSQPAWMGLTAQNALNLKGDFTDTTVPARICCYTAGVGY